MLVKIGIYSVFRLFQLVFVSCFLSITHSLSVSLYFALSHSLSLSIFFLFDSKYSLSLTFHFLLFLLFIRHTLSKHSIYIFCALFYLQTGIQYRRIRWGARQSPFKFKFKFKYHIHTNTQTARTHSDGIFVSYYSKSTLYYH